MILWQGRRQRRETKGKARKINKIARKNSEENQNAEAEEKRGKGAAAARGRRRQAAGGASGLLLTAGRRCGCLRAPAAPSPVLY